RDRDAAEGLDQPARAEEALDDLGLGPRGSRELRQRAILLGLVEIGREELAIGVHQPPVVPQRERTVLLDADLEPIRPDAPHARVAHPNRKSTRLNSSHVKISYAVFCL